MFERQDYENFIISFERLSPYELDHLSRAIHKKYQTGKKSKSLSKKDLQEILIAAMQNLQIEFAEQRLEEAKINLSHVKSKIYKRC